MIVITFIGRFSQHANENYLLDGPSFLEPTRNLEDPKRALNAAKSSG